MHTFYFLQMCFSPTEYLLIFTLLTYTVVYFFLFRYVIRAKITIILKVASATLLNWLSPVLNVATVHYAQKFCLEKI